MIPNPTRKGFITHLELSEARRIAYTNEPSMFDKKKLIQIGWKLFRGDRLPIDRIDEDKEGFNETYEMIRKHFRDETTQETKSPGRAIEKGQDLNSSRG